MLATRERQQTEMALAAQGAGRGFDAMATDPLEGTALATMGTGRGGGAMARDPPERMALAGAGGAATRSAGRPRRRGAPANRACPDRLRPSRGCIASSPAGSARATMGTGRGCGATAWGPEVATERHWPPWALAEGVSPRPGTLRWHRGQACATRRPATEATRSTGRLWRRGARASDGTGSAALSCGDEESDGLGNTASAHRRAYFRRFQKSTPAAENRWPARQAKA